MLREYAYVKTALAKRYQNWKMPYSAQTVKEQEKITELLETYAQPAWVPDSQAPRVKDVMVGDQIPRN